MGQRTDFDKLTMEVETNGALDPQAAVTAAAGSCATTLVTIFLGEPEQYRPEAPGRGAPPKGRSPRTTCSSTIWTWASAL